MVLWFLAVATTLLTLTAGAAIGYHLKEIYTRLVALKVRQDELEKEAEPIPQVIVAKTPKEVKRWPNTKAESAIVRAKTPKEVQRDKDRAFDEEMARLQ